MVGVFGDNDLGNQLLGRQPALDQSGRRRCLHNRLLAGAAGIFWPPGDNDLVSRWDDVEPL